MTRFAVPAVLVALLVLPASAVAAPDRALTVDDATPGATWRGAKTTAFNVSHFMANTTGLAACGKSAEAFCETSLVAAGPETTAKRLRVRIDGFEARSDFDLRVFDSDATGKRGTLLGSAVGDIAESSVLGEADPRHTAAGDAETFEVTGVKPGRHVLVEVVYFSVVDDAYTATLELR